MIRDYYNYVWKNTVKLNDIECRSVITLETVDERNSGLLSFVSYFLDTWPFMWISGNPRLNQSRIVY